jgi:histidinol-phosphate phosphatase family protein
MTWLSEQNIDREWFLFLDRDGVINRRIVDAYVRNWSEWEWLPGAKEAIVKFSKLFGRVMVVTNQKGIHRGLMTEEDLAEIHQLMCAEIEEAGGKLDAVYYCPEGDGAECRKPNPGMLFQAAKQFPEMKWQKSIVVGDAVTDMQMGMTVGIFRLFIGELPPELKGMVHGQYSGLEEMAVDLPD